MLYDHNSPLWRDRTEQFFRDRKFTPLRQEGPSCVITSLAILTGATPKEFQKKVNTQDPISWSDQIKAWGMKLAYCPTDARKLRAYIPELITLDDLFTLSYYTAPDSSMILRDPDPSGWICGSHVVVMHRDQILDPATGMATLARDHHCNDYHTKRIFRVVHEGYPRSL